MSKSVSPSVLIVGHGTRDPRGCEAFARVVEQVAALRAGGIVEGCFLELVDPDIASGIAKVVERGATHVAVVPLLLVAAGHARRDVPRQIAASAERFSGVTIRQAAHVGSHPALLELSERRFTEALASCGAAADETLLLFVGRGTKSAEANAELCRFARLRQERLPAGWCETCFLSMTEPSLTRTLEIARLMPFAHVVVQPHFLFHGELLDRITATVAEAASRASAQPHVVAASLGPDALLVEAIAQLADEVYSGSAAEKP